MHSPNVPLRSVTQCSRAGDRSTYHSAQISRNNSPSQRNGPDPNANSSSKAEMNTKARQRKKNNGETLDRVFHKVRINLTEIEAEGTHQPMTNFDELASKVEIVPKVLDNSETIMYNATIRNFHIALEAVDAPQVLSFENVIQVLNFLGFLQKPIINHEDLRLVSGVFHMLGGRAHSGVKRQNLLTFLMAINNHECPPLFAKEEACSGLHRDEERVHDSLDIEIGEFDENGNWIFSPSQQSTIQNLFRKLRYNKISSRSEYTEKDSVKKHQDHMKPSIHTIPFQYDRDKNNNSANKNSGQQCLSRVMSSNKKSKHERISALKEEQEAKVMKECTFQPAVMQPKRMTRCQSTTGMHRCDLLFSLSKQRSASNRKRSQTYLSTTDEIHNKEMGQCTFKPKRTPLRTKNVNPVVVRNCDKAVNRMLEGHHQRKIATVMKERGYPKAISNWNRFVQANKSTKGAHSSKPISRHESPRKPITTIEIKMCENQQQLLEVYEGDSLENLTCKLLVRNRLNYDYFPKLIRLIQEVLQESRLVSICDGFVYESSH